MGCVCCCWWCQRATRDKQQSWLWPDPASDVAHDDLMLPLAGCQPDLPAATCIEGTKGRGPLRDTTTLRAVG